MSDRPTMDAFPLSPMQQGMLFHSVSEPGSDVYVEQLSCRLLGALRVSAFQAAWEEMLRRHAVLRTAFAWRDLPEPLQVVGARVRLPLEVLDWRDLSGDEQGQRLRKLREAARREGFALGRAPLMRLKLVWLSEEIHELVWTWHHVILDAWSVPIVLEELLVAYGAQREGRAPDLAPTRPYKDFISWQRARDPLEAEAFWRGNLDGFEEPTPLGLDGLASEVTAAKAAGEVGEYGLEFLGVPRAEVEALRQAARRSRLTLNSFVLGAWSLLLSRYSGAEDVLFGTAVAGRPPELAGVETMVGLLINTLPVRIVASPQRRLGEWLAELQDSQAESRRYEQTPLRQAHAWSSVPRSRQLFESLLVFENYPVDMDRLRGNGLEISDVDLVERANFPLTVMMTVRDESKVGVGYDRSRFDRAMMRRMLHHLRRLLADMTRDPGRRLADLDFVGGGERDQIVDQFGRGLSPIAAHEKGAEMSISRLFETRVETLPDAPAVTFAAADGDVTLTYRELNARSNRLARRLRVLGVAPGDRVAICMEASLTRLVAILAVLKAGGAYVPIETTLPNARRCDLAADSGALLLLAEPELAVDLSVGEAAQVILLDDDWAPVGAVPTSPATDPEGSDNLADGPGPECLAYVVYTSGSTGEPKGVAVSHRSLRHLVEAQLAAFRIEPDSRVLQFASLGFDASVSEIFTALLAGARLYLAPRSLLVPSREFLALLARWRITTVTLPPSVLRQLPAMRLPALATLVSAGESCTDELVERWAPGRRFINAYGPTEVTICATLGPLSEVMGDRGRPSIGRPMGDARVYILDPELRPVPIGVGGEIHVAGPGVAWGYWARPGLTAASFLPDPLSGTPGGRLYRTGDLGRWLPAGEIDFLGRRDDQLKLRGVRVEPGEVEALLRREASVGQVAVLGVGSGDDLRLVAYLVAEHDPEGRPSPPEWWPSIAEYLVYDELAYYAMTSDERRNASYRAAIERGVRDRVVLEVGTGPEALLARFCADAGARKVYAVEMLSETYARARGRVAELGLEERIEVIHGDATRLELPQPADLCVSEIVGAIGGCEGAAVILNGVRRLLGEGAQMIPVRSTTLYAPVELPAALLQGTGFGPLPARYVDKIFAEIGYPFDLRLCVKGLDRSHLLAEPRVFEDLDFRRPVEAEYRREATHEIGREGVLDGFLVWLTLDTGAGERIDILDHEHCWLPVFFPVFEPRLAVRAGDRIESLAGALLCEDAVHPDYFVEGTVLRGGREAVPFRHESPHHARVFQASPFYGRFFEGGAVPRLARESRRAQTPSFDESALKQRLRQRLPDYMVPDRFVELESLPLTPSGKLDRLELAARTIERKAPGDRPLTPPGSEAERSIVEIWRQLLELDEVSLDSNFFDLGGHSLLLLKVQERIREKTGLEIPVTDLFAYPTVKTLAERLSRRRESSREVAGGRVQARGRATARQKALLTKAEARARAKAAGKRLKDKIKKELKEGARSDAGAVRE